MMVVLVITFEKNYKGLDNYVCSGVIETLLVMCLLGNLHTKIKKYLVKI